MKIKRSLLAALLLIMALAIATFAAACGGQKEKAPASNSGQAQSKANEPLKLNIATFNMGSSWYTYGATIAEVIRGVLPEGSQVNILAQAGGVGNPKLIGDEKVQMAIGFNVTDKWAYDGKEIYSDKKRDNIRGIAGYLDEYYFGIVARKDLGITDLAQLKEKKPKIHLMTVPVGGLGEVATKLVLQAYGVSYDDIKSWGGTVEHSDFNAIVDAFRDGKADMFMQTITKGHPAVTELATTTPVVFIPIGEDKIQELSSSYGFVRAEIPANSFKGQDKNIPTLGLTSTLITHSNVPDEIVYKITKAIIENEDRIRQGHKALEVFDPAKASRLDGLGVPLHPGAEKYYREAGLLK
ncbi:TRAP transporter solute receptor, TAXI family [Moorella glycerini]|uniref:TRAP transporter solute receptor, TAXI family n=1 Tax=Neomoorella stamsii TaxID=1266720 RepID=A0A9X7P6Z2_9FIRM|nr:MULTISPECIES: TAXI family TRAP transporter solute-binding subunit [Moorella]PRR75634.1 hypothetical protein MOST_08170 [Moorella stamsii]CEP66490.1 TRAP transporter solute receptor, TAXI family [Moorella glycerini]